MKVIGSTSQPRSPHFAIPVIVAQEHAMTKDSHRSSTEPASIAQAADDISLEHESLLAAIRLTIVPFWPKNAKA